MTTLQKTVWLVTGCSSGLGKSFAKVLAQAGCLVFATARNIDSLTALKEAFPTQIYPLKLDVTHKEDIQQAVQTVISRAGRIDGLINNAGYCYRAAIEEGEEAGIQELFQTHVFGPAALMQEVLPYMRRNRSGKIVNISSVAAITTLEGSGYYGAAKRALEGITSALQKEVSPLGITAMAVEPGAFRTDFSGRSLKESAVRIPDYEATAGLRRIENDHTHGTQCGDPNKSARLIIQAVVSPNPPSVFILGGDAWDIYEQIDAQRRSEMAPWLEESKQTCF